MASGDTKTEAMLNVLGNGGSGDEFRGCCNTKTQQYILDAIDRINSLTPGGDTKVKSEFTDENTLKFSGQTEGGDDATPWIFGYETDPETGDPVPTISDGVDTWPIVSGGGDVEVIHVLTEDDKNYPAANPSRIALWMLPDGIYTKSANIGVVSADGSITVKTLEYGGYAVVLSDAWNAKYVYIYNNNGSPNYIGKTSNGSTWSDSKPPIGTIDNLTSTSANAALSANQGKVLNDKINSISNYSTSEVNTGATWINGKTIYKKTIDTGALPNATTNNIAHGITNLDRIIKIEGWAYRSDDTSFFPLPSTSTGSVSANIVTTANTTYVNISTGTDRSNVGESYVTLYYTKTS